MVKNKIALAMIVKGTADEAPLLDNCLKSINRYVDRIFLYINHKKGEEVSPEVMAIAKKYQTTHQIGEWTYFGDARNKSFEMVTDAYDFILWLDSDDVVKNPKKLRKVVDLTPAHISGVYMAYEYQHDDFGNCIVEHYVARLVRNDGSFKWSDKMLHESLEPVRNCGKAMNEEVRIIHHADDERRDRSLQRNIEMLERELDKEDTNPDPRTLYYLGAAYLDAGNLEGSKELFTGYLELSGWPEERSQAWIHLGNIHDELGDETSMRMCYLQALGENPGDPTPYVELGKCEMRLELWGKAIVWLEMAAVRKTNPTTSINSSVETKYRAFMYLAECNFQQGGRDLDRALQWANAALEIRPDETTKEYYRSIQDVINHRDMVEGVVEQLKTMVEEKRENDIPNFIYNLPKDLQDNPVILRYKKRYTEPIVWPKNSLVIFCGNSVLGEWGPWSLEEGIGGSEEAVIRLSKEFQKKGWKVTVYATPGARAGEYDGIEWKNYWESDLRDTYDVFVAWRCPWFFDAEINARKKYLWMHDVMAEEELTEKRIKNFDKMIVLSRYHRTIFPMVPDNKIFLSANGITPEDFSDYEGDYYFGEDKILPDGNTAQSWRKPHRVIYMSSHVRGLELLYEIWSEVKKEVPDATLDIYYGWNSYDKVNRDNPERMKWKQSMIDKANELQSLGVTDHGKIGQQQIVSEIFGSGVWAYPCPFPEISCITAMKAQAGGAIPVSSDFAALKETVRWGEKIHMKQQDEKTPIGNWDKKDLELFKQKLIKTLKENEVWDKTGIRGEMMNWSREHQSWNAVCDQWIGEFK